MGWHRHRIPFGGLRTVGALEHAGAEGSVLAGLELTTAQSSTVLVACSVLPWKSPGKGWPGLPSHGQAAQLRHVLDHHVARIDLERQRGEPLIWGGDFNQQLTRPSESATVEGEQAWWRRGRRYRCRGGDVRR